MKLTEISAILFDKDGTLFDYSTSWADWVEHILHDLSKGNKAHANAMAATIMFDMDTRRFDPSSPVIAGTIDDAAELLGVHLPQISHRALVAYLAETSAGAVMVPPVPLVPLLSRFRDQGLLMGVATNDGEMPARAHLEHAGILDFFTHVLGYDSGFIPKPDPDMLLGYARLAGIAPETVVMVGDSTHDLVAGRAAGMRTIGVLTGLATLSDLAPYADTVVPDIGHLPDILSGS